MRHGRRKACTTESMTAPKSTMKTVDRAHPSTARTRTVPAAGGCSVLVETIIRMVRPTAAAAIRSLARWDSAANPPTGGQVEQGESRRNDHGDYMPAYHPAGDRCPAVRHHEHDEDAGCDRDNDRCPDHDVHDQHDSQQGQRG